ncbi:MAG: hypothetical protein ACI86M_003694, partial [Saprospiraceae bacterium]
STFAIQHLQFNICNSTFAIQNSKKNTLTKSKDPARAIFFKKLQISAYANISLTSV